MAKKMSFKSISYSRVSDDFEAQSIRFTHEVSYLPIRSYKDDKITQLSYLKDKTKGLQSVFRAEFVKTLTLKDIKKHLENLRIALEETSPGMIFKISCHPQSDATTKSSHFHIWGDITPEMEKVFESYLINNKLTIQTKVNITAIDRGELRKVELNKDGNEEIRKVTFESRTGHYIVDKNGIKSNNVTESIILDVLKIDKEVSVIDNSLIDEELAKELKNSDIELEKLIKSAEFEEFENKYKITFENLNQNIDNFLSNVADELEKIEKKAKEILIYNKEI